MKDFNGIEYLKNAERYADNALQQLAARYVIVVSSTDISNFYYCYSINFKKFELTENETKESVFKKAMEENVSIFKQHLAEKWMEELENDY